jgi:hypothetical protein
MPHEPQTIYDLLVGQTVAEATLENLDSATGKTFLENQTLEYWQGIMTIAHIVKASRTYSHGLPIPELSTVATSGSLPGGETFDFRPTGTEEWQIMGIEATSGSGTPTGGIFLYDGSTSVIMHSGSTSTTGTNLFPMEAPFIITNSLYLRCVNMDGSIAQTFDVAYHKVGL